jgi:hypothetical protein
MAKITLNFIIDFFTDKSIITTKVKSNILEFFQLSDEKCEKKFNDFIDLLMFVIDKDYDINILSNKKNYLYTITDDIINYIQDTNLIINKPKIISQIKNNEMSQDIILLMAYIFDINILVHENNILKTYYFSERFNKYRNTILFKVEQDVTDGTEYYKLLINNDKFIFNGIDKNLRSVLEKEYIIPIGFIPNKSFCYNEDENHIVNDRSISEIFITKQVLEIKENERDNIKSVEKEVPKDSVSINSDSDTNPNMTDKLMMDYTNMNFDAGLESDDD